MRVAHLITGLGLGGAEAVLTSYVLRDTVHSHSVVSLTDTGFHGPRIERGNVPVIALGGERGGGAHLPRKLARLLRSDPPDVLFAWMYHAQTLSAVAKWAVPQCRVIWGIHASSVSLRHSRFVTNAIARMNGPLSHLVPDRIVSCSEVGAGWHRRWGYRRAILRVIPNGLDAERFFPDAQSRHRFRGAFSIDKSTFLIGYVARLDPQKDHGTLFAAMSRLRDVPYDWRLVLAGTGLSHDNEALKQLLSERRIADRCILLGEVLDVPTLMNGLDLHVMSSSYGEAFPGVICEAMACGTPVVATDVGDSGLIMGQCGQVVPRGNSEALAAVILRALKKGPGRRSKAAVERIHREFSLDRMVSAYSATISEFET